VPPDLRDPNDDERFTVSRRSWLRRVAGVSIGAGLAATSGHDKLIPLLRPQHDLLPGTTTYFATTCRECPAGCGMLVANREGRVIKCEGNPDHPINHGKLCSRGQAALQGLYDPDRLRTPLQKGKPTTWDIALRSLGEALRRLRGAGRVAVISDLQTGSLEALIRRWLELFGSERYLIYEPLSYDGLREANRQLLGRPAIPVPTLDEADFILSFGADFLETWISPVQFTRQFASRRVPNAAGMSRFVYVGPRISMTAANADERVLVRPGDERYVALAMLHVLRSEGLARGSQTPAVPNLSDYAPEAIAGAIGVEAARVRQLARAFGQARAPLALAGDPLADGPDAIETVLAANLLNLAVASPAFGWSAAHALGGAARCDEAEGFLGGLEHSKVDVLLLIGANPGYTGYLSGLVNALPPVPTLVALSPFRDDTADLAGNVLPVHTPLESWGDYEPQTGILGIMQPAMGPLYSTRMTGDVLLALAQAAGFDLQREFGASTFREYLATRWEPLGPAEDLLQRGGAWGQSPPSPVAPAATPGRVTFGPLLPPSAGLRLHLYPSMHLFDGRGANKRWLQELPDPLTNVAWSSWVEIPPSEAQKLGVQTGDLVKIRLPMSSPGDRTFSAPAVVHPGLALGTIAVPLGQGHTAYGRYAQGLRANGYLLGASVSEPRIRLPVTRLEEPALLPCADGSPYQHGRGIVRVVKASELDSLPEPELRLPLPEGYEHEDMYPGHQHRNHRWAMAVDLARCTGCGACTAACYAENNIGVVGPQRFAEHRVMSWVRIERYFDWSNRATPVLFLPLMCQQCDSAPCEAVCPVFASAHNEDGLNMQVYNRCVGTRYCSNNCPYRARRFNWFDYEWPEPLNWQANPEVTVRCRGVMEKCTFCIQRLREAGRRAKREKRKARDGDAVPACVQTCPADALVFGDLLDPESRISRIVRGDRRAYQLLDELNTKPAVFYLRRIVRDVWQA
jgi:molybdopterin-containing oxidoreductase family iron-sulfur binding subunit